MVEGRRVPWEEKVESKGDGGSKRSRSDAVGPLLGGTPETSGRFPPPVRTHEPRPSGLQAKIHCTVARCYSDALLFEAVHGRIPTEMTS